MKKILHLSTLTFLFFSSLLTPVYAVTQITCPLAVCTIAGFIDRVAAFIQPLAVLALIACVVGAGFIRLTSSGDSEKEQKSVKILTSAAIGFAIIVLAPFIVRVLTTLLGVNPALLP